LFLPFLIPMIQPQPISTLFPYTTLFRSGFQLMTRPEYHRWLTSLKRSQVELKLTGASRETLAIVAYRQPIMRADIEAIRGVHCRSEEHTSELQSPYDLVCRLLLEKKKKD